MTDSTSHEIRMDHPNKNALDDELVTWLSGELDSAGERPILLTGTDSAFSAGLNLRRVADLDAVGLESFLRRVDALASRIFLHPAPVVAAVNGHAIAGGCVLALTCDHRVATTNGRARFGVNEVALGACFPPAILRLVAHRVPPQHRERVMLGAGLFAPDEALAVGLVDELADDPLTTARQRLQGLARHPARTYAITKRVLHEPVVTVTAEDERRFREEELPIWASPEMKERVLAVLGGAS